jgi:hypothetical protein
VVETWLTDKLTDAMVVGTYQYDIIRFDRDSRAGGVCAIFRTGLIVANNCSSDKAEAFSIVFPVQKLNFIVGYLPDSYNDQMIDNLAAFIVESIKPNYSNIVVGDFNLSTACWSSCTAGDLHHRRFMDLIAPIGLVQLVHEPTRGDNILDLIFVDCDRLVYNVVVQDHLGTSDHCMVSFMVHCTFSRSERASTPGGRIDFERLRLNLGALNWSNLFASDLLSVDQVWDLFIDVIAQETANCRSFVKQKIGRNRLPTPIIKLLRRKLILWHRYKASRSAANLQSYNECKNLYISATDKWKASRESAVITEGNLSALFRFYRRETGLSRTIPPLKVGTDFITDATKKAELFNGIFAANGIADDGSTVTLDTIAARIGVQCDNIIFTPTVVKHVLGKIKPSHAAGPDGFSAFFYKQICHEISIPLARIFELSMQSGKLPSIWTTAKVVPILKKGDSANPHNYRPISLTAVPCKIMETIIRDRMLLYLNEFNLINSDQFGFMPGRSSTHQLLAMLDKWTDALDCGVPSDVILFDFQKAFESVVHSKLLRKLQHVGFDGSLLQWIKSFTEGRSQRVIVDDNYSASQDIISGVPQGSVLGPLLFVIYLNDLVCDPEDADQRKFADDLKLSSAIIDSKDSKKLSVAINYVSSWATRWQLPISIAKCRSFHIGRHNPLFNYSLNNCVLPSISEVKDLGVWFTADLKSSLHCEKIVSAAYRRLAIVNRCFTSGNTKIKVWAFKVFVRPLLEYAGPVWSPSLLKDIDRVEAIQRRFTKQLLGLRDCPYGIRLKRVGLDSLELRRLRADLLLTFKIVRGILAVDLPFFEISQTTWTRGHCYKLVLPTSRLDCRRSFFAVRVVPAWNSLTEEMVTSPTSCQFYRLLKDFNLNRFLKRPEFA